MTVSLDELTQYVGATAGAEDAWLASCLRKATSRVSSFIRDNKVSPDIPSEEVDSAILVVADEIYNQRTAPNGFRQYTGDTGGVRKVNRDAMEPAYPILNPYRYDWGV